MNSNTHSPCKISVPVWEQENVIGIPIVHLPPRRAELIRRFNVRRRSWSCVRSTRFDRLNPEASRLPKEF